MIGREKEIQYLKEAINDDRSHYIAIYGRSRIGKTFLIRETFNSLFTFDHAGLFKGNINEQLFSFDCSLENSGLTAKEKSRNWLEAFEKLKQLVRTSADKKKIIFIDELSWMDSKGSDLIMALENLVLVIFLCK